MTTCEEETSVFVAVPLGQDSANSSCDSSLESAVKVPQQKGPLTEWDLTISTSFMGLIMGTLVAGSTAGVNYLLTVNLANASSRPSFDVQNKILFYTMCWSFCALVAVLGFLNSRRKQFASVLNEQVNETNGEDKKQVMQSKIVRFECCFVIGALVGGFIGWGMLDLALGCPHLIYDSFLIVAFSLLWFGVANGIGKIKSSRKSTVAAESEGQDEVQTAILIV